MKTIRILLVGDQDMAREGLRGMLKPERDMQIVGEATNTEGALAQVDLLSPDVILMDIKMPGMGSIGIGCIQKLKEEHPSCNVIVLTGHEDYLRQATKAGAAGFLLNSLKPEELAMAIRAIYLLQVALFHNGSPFALIKL